LIPLADAPYYRITSRCLPKALASATKSRRFRRSTRFAHGLGPAHGADSTQRTSWGRLYVVPFFAEWTTTRSKLRAPTAMGRRSYCVTLSLIAIDVCSYAVMSHHYHLGLKLFPELLNDLSDEQIMDRWWAIDPIDPDQVI
jgi:hypothetical protein